MIVGDVKVVGARSRVIERDTLSKRQALVVEPTAALARLLPGMLGELGFEVEVVTAPEDAFALAESGRAFELLVTELALPEISGRTVAGFVTSRQPATLVLYLCDALARASVEQSGSAALEKPFSLQDLSDTLGRLFASRPI